MKKLLVAITYHNQTQTCVWKSWRSTMTAAIEGWQVDTMVFAHDKIPKGIPSIMTHQETLGGKRNFAREYARNEDYALIAFLDDDDLFGSSWIPGLCAAYDEDLDSYEEKIFHPQWNVLFGPKNYALKEHMSDDDPRFDSRDMMFTNPWSALCAFRPGSVLPQYKIHSAKDKKYSFEDWTFNLDTFGDFRHVAVPNTYHFLRIRGRSLGKSTITNNPAHTRYFLGEKRSRKIATEDFLDPKRAPDPELLKSEFTKIHSIEPSLYLWSTKEARIEYPERVPEVVEVIDALGAFDGVRDVFWMEDHNRVGGAEKALRFMAKVCAQNLTTGTRSPPLWIDDANASKPGVAAGQWTLGMQNVLRSWQDEKTYARSIHICNTMFGWEAICKNPNLFDRVQVYFYVFNDDLCFSDKDMDPETMGYHSPLYRYADFLDRENFHIITDNMAFAKKIKKITGLSDVRIMSVPVDRIFSKRKTDGDGVTDILWAGRFDYFKGIEETLRSAQGLSANCRIHFWGKGLPEFVTKIRDAQGPSVVYRGPYKKFDEIEGKYDYFLFTSEREGMPNVVKEAIVANLPVLSSDLPYAHDLQQGATPPLSVYPKGGLLPALKEFKGSNFHSGHLMFEEEPAWFVAENAIKECFTIEGSV